MLTIGKASVIRLIKPLRLDIRLLLVVLDLGIRVPLVDLVLIEHANEVNILFVILEPCKLIVFVA